MTTATKPAFSGRVGLQQRVLPAYRAPFFEALAKACPGGLSVFAGAPRPEEAINPAVNLESGHLDVARNHHFFSVSHPLFLCWQGGLGPWLEKWDPEVLIAEANPRYLSTPRAIRWMRARGRPAIGWGLGAPPLTGPLVAVQRRYRQRFLLGFDALIAYSQRGAKEYRALGFPADSVFVASNAAAPRPSAPPPERPPRFEGRPGLLFVGRLQARKRIDLLLQACADLPSELQPRLWIVGDGPAREALEALGRQLYPLAEFPGALHGQDLEPYFANADLFALPGTGGLAVQQAISQGLPVIVAEGDGTQEDLVRPENGWLIPPDDLNALTAALRTALSDPHQLRRMGLASYRIAAQEINLEAMVSVFLDVIQRMNDN